MDEEFRLVLAYVFVGVASMVIFATLVHSCLQQFGG